MYALTYKKKSCFSKLVSLILKHKILTLCFVLGIYQFSGGVFIYAKATLGQYLIADAWHKNLQSDKTHKPWPWADTHPIAELILNNKSWFVLAGASGRNLAFAPTHVSSTVEPGENGNSVIIGHRDTQFAELQRLQKGDIVKVRTKHGYQKFEVTQLRIALIDQVNLMLSDSNFYDDQAPSLTLITCYPFDSMRPNPTHRYVVKATAI